MLQTIQWTGEAVRLLDQTRLPLETTYVDIVDERQMWDAIKRLVVRGAPAIGVAAAFGVYLGVRGSGDGSRGAFGRRLSEVCDYLATSRPTAVNLFWAIERIRRCASEFLAALPASEADVSAVRVRILQEAVAMLEEDTQTCRAIGEAGVALFEALPRGPQGDISVLTHCNAGGLCSVEYGTALAPIYTGAERGLRFHVFADETRPLLQGSRITAYELQRNGVPVTVICDNMAASVMAHGKVAAVIVGADRIAANGDVANKIGTLGVAILARHFGIPFYVAAPMSTVDFKLSSGDGIPIEQRDPAEVTAAWGRATAPPGVAVHNPAFDVTPAALVTAIITERGVLTAPYREALTHARRRLSARTFRW